MYSKQIDVMQTRRLYSILAKKNTRCVLIGGPGAGKGTQTKRMQSDFGFSALSSGDLLRAEVLQNTDFGLKIEKYINKGKLVPDSLILQLILDKVAGLGEHNWLLDGFPRTVGQAKALDAKLKSVSQPLSAALYLDVPDSVILQRVQDRWIHGPSGRTYNYSFNPPKVHGLDDVTGEPLTKRNDDNVEAFKERLIEFKQSSAPVIEHYKSRGLLYHFKGTSSDTIYPEIRKLLEQLNA